MLYVFIFITYPGLMSYTYTKMLYLDSLVSRPSITIIMTYT